MNATLLMTLSGRTTCSSWYKPSHHDELSEKSKETAINYLNMPVERYVETINDICARLEAEQDELAHCNVVAALKKLESRNDNDERENDEDQTWGAIEAALDYYQRDGDQVEECLQGYGSFGPMSIMSSQGGGSNVYPAKPAKLPEEARQTWRELAAVETLNPLVRGRLCDLLWKLGDGPSPHTHAEAAVLCYVTHSQRENAEPCGRDESVRRATALAATLNNQTLLSKSLDATKQLVASSLDTAHDEFGIVARCLQALTDHTQNGRNRHLDASRGENKSSFAYSA